MERTKLLLTLPLFLALLPAVSGTACAASVSSSTNKHNLSVTGPGIAGVTRSTTETRICIFCHTPHHANTLEQLLPLWTKGLSSATYDLYASSSLKSRPQQPNGSSRLCLSCHDGTIALGMTHSGAVLGGLSARIPAGGNLGNDAPNPSLLDDHPISFPYPDNNLEIRTSASLPPQIRLEDGQLQCVSCHDPHDNAHPYFQVIDNKAPGSPLCTTCHANRGWTESVHVDIQVAYPQPPKPAETVYGCDGCHASHNVSLKENLLRGDSGKNTCLLVCHNGSQPTSQYGKDVSNAFARSYFHRVGQYPNIHKDDESPLDLSAVKHVECYDCHNPHAVTAQQATAPTASGALQQVKIQKLADDTFLFSTTEYDVCYKCHAESNASFRYAPENLPARIATQANERYRFTMTNASYHPVAGKVNPSNVTNVTGLKANFMQRDGTLKSLDINSVIYCRDCHDPHGSNEQHMLLDRYLQDSVETSYSSNDYALCFRCHDEARLLDEVSSSFRPHKLHVVTNHVPCSVCHDPHGVQANLHLVNFDTRPGFVDAINPPPIYDSGTKSCTVSCHTVGGQTHSYDSWTAGAAATRKLMLRRQKR